MAFVRCSGVIGMKQAADGRPLPRYRLGPRDWLQLAYLAAAVILVGFIGLFGFALIFNEVTILGWLFVGGFFAFRHGFLLHRDRLAVSGTATAKTTSAAIGLAELSGRGYSDQIRKAPVTQTECLFWSIDVHQWQRHSKRKGWVNKLHNTFGVETLELEDAFGRVLVWTRGAELVRVKQTWRSEDGHPPAEALRLVANMGLPWPDPSSKNPMKITEERIQAGAPLYVMGTLNERRQIPDKPNSWLACLLQRWASTAPRLDGQSFSAAFQYASQGGRRWLARDLQTIVPRWVPPAVDPHQVVVWKGDQRRAFIISGLIEQQALRALSRRAWLYILGGGGLMAGMLLVSIWKLTDVIR